MNVGTVKELTQNPQYSENLHLNTTFRSGLIMEDCAIRLNVYTYSECVANKT